MWNSMVMFTAIMKYVCQKESKCTKSSSYTPNILPLLMPYYRQTLPDLCTDGAGFSRFFCTIYPIGTLPLAVLAKVLTSPSGDSIRLRIMSCPHTNLICSAHLQALFWSVSKTIQKIPWRLLVIHFACIPWREIQNARQLVGVQDRGGKAST